MAPELRRTGISIVGDVPWGTHFCTFYETTQDLLDILVPFFKTGLENNEFCLWIISNSELLTVSEATTALRQVDPGLDKHLSEGRIETVDHDNWFLSEGSFDSRRVARRFGEKLDQALANGYAGMRVNGSPAWLYKDDDKDLIQFENEVDQLFPDLRIIASCTYPIRNSAAAALLNVANAHRFVITRRHGKWDVLETPELIQAKQEIAILNERLEQRVVERTKELTEANKKLRSEIAERKKAEDALRRSEDHLRLVIDTIPVMAWSVRPDGVVDFLNQRWMHYTGLSLNEYIKEPTGPIHPEDIPRVIENWLAKKKAGEAYDDEMRLRGADGKYRWFLVRTSPLHDESGQIIKWYGVSTDIDERKRAEEQLRSAGEQLRALSASLRSAREQESTRIAREIHDELGGALTSLRWDLEDVSDVVTEAQDSKQLSVLPKRLEEMVKLTETTLDTVRRLASELRPIALDELGLVEAIEWQARQFESRTGIVVDYECSLEKVDLDKEQSIAAFRILQEALTNILRHAQASRVTIKMNQQAGEFLLTIGDNGIGITEPQQSSLQSLGLLGMRERALLIGAKVDITGREGKGTLVAVRIPISIS